MCTSTLRPAALIDNLYDAIDESDPSFVALVDSIREHGILEPLVVGCDGYTLSSHRRHAVASQLNIDRIPVRIRSDVGYVGKQMRLVSSTLKQPARIHAWLH